MIVNIDKWGHLVKERDGLGVILHCPYKSSPHHCGDFCPQVKEAGFFRKKIKTCGATFTIGVDYRMTKEEWKKEQEEENENDI